jgi:drug/metabolite transporter (DMT)-like permease
MITGFSILALGESVTFPQLLCFVGVLVGAFLVTTAKKFVFNRGYIPAIASMVAFGCVYIFRIYALQNSGGVLLPNLISVIMALLAMFVYLRLSPESNKKFRKVRLASDRRTLAKNMILGVLQGTGSLLLLTLATLNFVAVGSMIVAAEPALVILLGYTLYKDRFVAHQVVGFVLLILSVLILSAL